MAYSGLRWGEAAALRCGCVRGNRLRVVQSLSEVGGAHFKPTKTYGSRTVVLPRIIGDLRAAHTAARGEPDPERLVFTAPGGGPLHSRNFRRRVWFPALEAAGLPSTLRMHDLRHSCAALMVSEGANPKQLQAHLGHSSISVTLDTYGHLFTEDVEALAQRMDRRIRQRVFQGVGEG